VLRDADDDDPVAIAAITASELLHGVHRVTSVAIPVIAFDLDVARVHAQLDADLSARGVSVGDADLMIAATAVWLDYRVATRDLRSFPRIEGLDIVTW
jgi:tRNA(fMet)-specific endonuclease VapC